jgi:8-amino-7-oxononanoate synthase
MKPLFSKRTHNIIADRCRADHASKLRRKYEPWYHEMASQQGTRVKLDNREFIMLSSNDYLGLTTHPKVIEAAEKALHTWGSSATGSRMANGSRRCHREIEEALAAFLGKEACHVTSAGYLSCLSAVAGFATRGDVVLVDRNIHACIWDGIRLSRASMERFCHNSPADLREVFRFTEAKAAKLLVIEGVYSMEGHIAPLPDFLDAAQGHGCFVVLDDAHGLGVLGRQGRGTADHFGVGDQIDIICGSLSKSLSSTGGFVAGSTDAIEFLRTHSRQTIFSAAISPVQAACAQAALEIMQDEPEHLDRLWNNTRRYRALLEDLKLDTWGSETPALPVVLGSKERAYLFWKALMKEGIFTVMAIAPGVPPGKDLIRTAISAAHTDEDLERIEAAFRNAVRKI